MSEKIKGQLHDSQDDLYARWVQAGRPVNAPEKQEKDGLVSSEYLFTQTRERSIGKAAIKAVSEFREERKIRKEERENSRDVETVTFLQKELQNVTSERDAEIERRKEAESQLAKVKAKLEAIKKLLSTDRDYTVDNAELVAVNKASKDHIDKYPPSK